MKSAFVYMLLCFQIQVLAKETPKIDSLRSELAKTTDDQTKVDLLIQIAESHLVLLAESYQVSNSDEVLTHSTQAIERAEKISYQPGLAKAYFILGRYYYSKKA